MTIFPISAIFSTGKVPGRVEPARSPPRCRAKQPLGRLSRATRGRSRPREGRERAECVIEERFARRENSGGMRGKLGGPLRLDQFHGFADMRKQGGAGEANAEVIIIAHQHRDVALRSESLDVRELARAEEITG